jgi:hypothetical protein
VLLRREDLVVVAVNGGAPRRAVWHCRDWDPARAQHPRAEAPEVRRRHVPRLIQGTRLPLVEVLAAEAVRLVVGRCGVGKCGEEEESSAARMSNNGTKEPFFIAASSGGRARVARIYASPCSEATPRCAAAQTCAGAFIPRGRRGDGRVEMMNHRCYR